MTRTLNNERQLKHLSSSQQDEAKNEDCQPVRKDDQPIHRVMACSDYSGELPGLSE